MRDILVVIRISHSVHDRFFNRANIRAVLSTQASVHGSRNCIYIAGAVVIIVRASPVRQVVFSMEQLYSNMLLVS